MIELRNALKPLLTLHYPKVYYQKVPDIIIYPHVVYDLPTSFVDEDIEVFNLDVDIYDNNLDTTSIEEISDKFWRGLDKARYLDENIQFTIYRENRLPPINTDTNINQRKLIFQLRYFDRRSSNV
ncbi:hypothetical protein FZC76_06845 [Sutcliffiella horikoshii]|uniref:DUF3168 domain-containing protein n=1 Tax=Sutcliffiella horikoshii TaxID=79883 RepID=A0A5D4T210_9BACI|nr:hypothetical protein [Sutcliffiella horikoshii]TYS68658.1 hypothetical protein FZC76_06845 [Sutcliffiella horikoshii]